LSHEHHDNEKQKLEHGTMSSYVIGFILSLVFTIIPYYIVVNKSITGNSLTAAILGFAVLQMIIQITFFLHLGRGPKPKWNLFFFMSTVGIILFIVTASILIMNHLHYNMAPSDQTKKLVNNEGIYQLGGVQTGACQQVMANHKITIKNGIVSPYLTNANKCDSLTFINEDEEELEISFGNYPDRKPYAGEIELNVRSGVNETITLSELGSYMFHDHHSGVYSGQFIVAP
jgi:cytochrome o ubiquinol oxidase operon protein cyoD